MKLSITYTKNNTYFYMVKSYRNNTGKSTSKIIEKLGTLEEVTLKANVEEPIIWAKNYIKKKTKEENENNAVYYEKFVENEELDSSLKIYNIGYLFIKNIFYKLQLDELCDKIASENKFEYDMSKILQDLLYTRILCPSSKLSAFEEAKKFIEQPNYELHDIYRALSVIAQKKESIEKWCYKTSLNKIPERNTKILYYDCTNYFFEIEQEDEDNTKGEKVYIVAQSLKNLEKHYQEIAISNKDWRIENSSKKYDLSEVDKYNPNNKNIYYKEFIIERKKKNEKNTTNKINKGNLESHMFGWFQGFLF